MKDIQNFLFESNEIRHDKKNQIIVHVGGGKLVYNEDVIVTLTEKTDNTMEIDYLEVPKKQQRMHIGQKMVNIFIEYAKEQKKDIVVAAYPIENLISQADLIKFYKSCGFEQDEHSTDKNVLRYKV